MADKRSRKRKAYTLDQVKKIASHGLMELERIILSDSENAEKIRACNSLASLMNSYSRLSEMHELSQRIEELERRTNIKKAV